MPSRFANFEQTFFRKINSFVEPAVRMGIGSPRFTPASLIVLETTGFKSGEQRRTPLWSIRVGRYRIVSTARGKRSFWLKNMQQQPAVSYFLGGRRRDSNAIVVAGGVVPVESKILSPAMQKLAAVFSRYTEQGWAFVILAPGITPSEELANQLRDSVKSRLAKHEVPKLIEFVDGLPMTTTGKIMRRELREREKQAAAEN